MAPSSLNNHLWWEGVLCVFLGMDLRFTGVPIKVGLLFAKIDVLAFLWHSLFITLNFYVTVDVMEIPKNKFSTTQFKLLLVPL